MRRLQSWQCLDLREALCRWVVFIRIICWYKNKGQTRGIDSVGIPVNILFFFWALSPFCYWVEKRPTTSFSPFSSYTKFHSAFVVVMNESGEEGIRERQMCPHLGGRIGAAWFGLLSIIKHLTFYRQNTRAQTTPQEHRERKCFSQPEAGLQGYMLYLIPWTPHRPDAERILLMS